MTMTRTTTPLLRMPISLRCMTLGITCWMALQHATVSARPSVLSTAASVNRAKIPPAATTTMMSIRTNLLTIPPRGGSSSPEPSTTTKKKRKRKKRKKKSTTTSSDIPSQASTKAEVSQAMRQKDTAEALGDAIRDRANVLRSDLQLSRIDDSVASVGWAMGASDYTMESTAADTTPEQQEDDIDDGGGVEAAPTSVLANYFLKSHGGAHALQCVCSLLATLTAIGAIVLPCSSELKATCLKRSLQLTLTKHLSGLLAASTMAAKAIPSIGLRQARVWMETLALDPVSQYLFYASLLLFWLPPSEYSNNWWWQTPVGKYTPLLMLGPILLREAISTAFVVNDVLVLLLTTTTNQDDSVPPFVLTLSTSFTNAIMSLLVTPNKWKSSNSAQRQIILAKLTSRICLVLELLVGALLVMDAMVALWQQSFSQQRPSVVNVVKRIICARLYINYLLVKKRKITKLASEVRGGASQFPMHVLNILLEPRASMGLSTKTSNNNAQGDKNQEEHDNNNEDDEKATITWLYYAKTALGL